AKAPCFPELLSMSKLLKKISGIKGGSSISSSTFSCLISIFSSISGFSSTNTSTSFSSSTFCSGSVFSSSLTSSSSKSSSSSGSSSDSSSGSVSGSSSGSTTSSLNVTRICGNRGVEQCGVCCDTKQSIDQKSAPNPSSST